MDSGSHWFALNEGAVNQSQKTNLKNKEVSPNMQPNDSIIIS